MATKHTGLPWRKDIGDVMGEPYLRSVLGPDGQTIRLKGFAIAGGNVGQEEGEANTDFVLRAVNCHADLLAMLHEAAEFVQPFNRSADFLDRIEALIAKAESA